MLKIFEELKRSDPNRCQQLLLRTHAKNVQYLQRVDVNPELAKFVAERGTGVYAINIGASGIEVRHRETGALLHPPGRFLQYMSEFGSWHHSGWVDKLAMLHVWRGPFDHGKAVNQFLEALYAAVPALHKRMETGEVRLPLQKDGRRYSGPVVFLGISTGLHIVAYMNRTVVRDVFLIEPDLDRFALSCYFLDYEALNAVVRRLLMHVGPDAPQSPIDQLITSAPITASSWVRFLPAYPEGKFDDILNRVSLRWRGLMEIFVPYDREKKNLEHGMRNIHDRLPLPVTRPTLSPASTIAVVASGPSLAKEMSWLKANQDRLIIAASISCIRVLKENGIRVDYQCTLDTEIDEPLFESLQLDPDVTMVAYYKLNPELVAKFKRVLLVPDLGKANPVRFLKSMRGTHPTTGNLMTSFAAWCRPAQLIFVGLDLGFREASESHVRGGWHDESEGAGHVEETGGRDHIDVAANFPESEGQIKTMAYYNSARFNVEAVLEGVPKTTRVLNLADGAKVKGAEAMHSANLTLPEYPERSEDLEAISAGFSRQHDGIYEGYSKPGRELICDMVESLMTTLDTDKPFQWSAWSRMLDVAWGKAVADTLGAEGDMRVEIFGRLIHDLLSEWYRVLLLTESEDEIRIVLDTGKKELRRLLEAQADAWPVELDEFSTKAA